MQSLRNHPVAHASSFPHTAQEDGYEERLSSCSLPFPFLVQMRHRYGVVEVIATSLQRVFVTCLAMWKSAFVLEISHITCQIL